MNSFPAATARRTYYGRTCVCDWQLAVPPPGCCQSCYGHCVCDLFMFDTVHLIKFDFLKHISLSLCHCTIVSLHHCVIVPLCFAVVFVLSFCVRWSLTCCWWVTLCTCPCARPSACLPVSPPQVHRRFGSRVSVWAVVAVSVGGSLARQHHRQQLIVSPPVLVEKQRDAQALNVAAVQRVSRTPRFPHLPATTGAPQSSA